MEPWFRRRWYGWQPIHRNGWLLWGATGGLAVAALLAMGIFAWVDIRVSAVIFIVFLGASIPLNAVILSRTEKP